MNGERETRDPVEVHDLAHDLALDQGQPFQPVVADRRAGASEFEPTIDDKDVVDEPTWTYSWRVGANPTRPPVSHEAKRLPLTLTLSP